MKDLRVFKVEVSPWQYFWRTYVILARDELDALEIGTKMAAAPTHKPGYDIEGPQFQIEVTEIDGPFERGSLLYSHDYVLHASTDYR